MTNNEMELYAQMDSQVKTSGEVQKIKLKTTPRYLKDAVKGAGFTFNQSVAEFVDNSLDAKAKKIVLKAYIQPDGYYSLELWDDGKGIPSNKILDVVTEVGHGSQDDYQSTSISNYGLGMKYALINICKEGSILIESVHDGLKATMTMNVDGQEPYVTEPKIEYTSESSHTRIFIPSLELNNSKISKGQITSLLKFFGSTYFPHIDRGNDLSIELIVSDEKYEVVFTDPFYRNLSPTQGVQSNDDDCIIDGLKIAIQGKYFDQNFNNDSFNQHDIKQGSSGFAAARSGIYWRLNGRYITLGEGDFLKLSEQQIRNRIRIEVDIDRELIRTLGVGFNKSKITIVRENEKLKEFISKIDQIVNWGIKLAKKETKPCTDASSLEERSDLDKDIGAIRRQIGHENYTETLPEIIKPQTESIPKKDPTQSKDRPSGLEYNKGNFKLLYVNSGEKNVAFDYGRDNKQMIVHLNIDHPFGKIYMTKEKETKKSIDMLLLSFIDGLIATKMDHSDQDFEIWQSDLISNFSHRLSKYFVHY
jgi:hypothetical protein